MEQRHGRDALAGHARRNEAVHATALDYDARATAGRAEVIYRYDDGVLGGDDLSVTDREIRVRRYRRVIPLDTENPYTARESERTPQSPKQKPEGSMRELSPTKAENLRFWTQVFEKYSFTELGVEAPTPTARAVCDIRVPGSGRKGQGLHFGAFLFRANENMGCYLTFWEGVQPAERIFRQLYESPETLQRDYGLETWTNSPGKERIGFWRELQSPLQHGSGGFSDFDSAVEWMGQHLRKLVSALHPRLQNSLAAESRRSAEGTVDWR